MKMVPEFILILFKIKRIYKDSYKLQLHRNKCHLARNNLSSLLFNHNIKPVWPPYYSNSSILMRRIVSMVVPSIKHTISNLIHFIDFHPYIQETNQRYFLFILEELTSFCFFRPLGSHIFQLINITMARGCKLVPLFGQL